MKRFASVLFYVAAVYDAVLGVAFVALAPAIFDAFGVTRPNHLGYVQFPGLLLVIFALIFLRIARAPQRNRGLIVYGILLKASFCGVVLWHWLLHEIPGMWKPLALADAVFGVLFVWAYIGLAGTARNPAVIASSTS
jgi:hypothetical protein